MEIGDENLVIHHVAPLGMKGLKQGYNLRTHKMTNHS